MISKGAANEFSDALIAEKAAPMKERRRRKLEQRYSMVFGKDFGERCARELSLKKAQIQWRVLLFVSFWLGLVVILAFLSQAMSAAFMALFGCMCCKNLIGHYARRHFQESDACEC